MNHIGVVVCEHPEAPGARADAVRRLFELEAIQAEVEEKGDLCREPRLLEGFRSRLGVDRLILLLCGPSAPIDELGALARAEGIDPFGVETVFLEGLMVDEGATPELLLGAAARCRAFRGTAPEQARVRLVRGPMTRRTLFSSPVAYDPAAWVDPDMCLGTSRCGICLKSCGAGAIVSKDGRAVVDTAACGAAGSCVVACPVGAIGLPRDSLEEHEARLAALVRAAGEGPFGVVFECRRATPHLTYEAGWLSFPVASLGMVTAGWILQTVSRGGAVALRACRDPRHAFEHRIALERVDYCQQLLRRLAVEDPELRAVMLHDDRDPPPMSFLHPRVGEEGCDLVLREPVATATAVRVLAGRRGVRELRLEGAAASTGLVDVDEGACTACGVCASVCPTAALRYERRSDGVTLTYDAGSCTGCGRCVEACPEEAIVQRLGVDLGLLGRGRIVVREDELASCRCCGGTIAPEAVLTRMRALLDGEPGLLEVITTRCLECRH